jgi:Uma2 family endonuclease
MNELPHRATLADLFRTEGQAELIGGRVVRHPFLGVKPARICGDIMASLHDAAERTGGGEAGTTTLVYVVPLLPSGRETFSPDASFYDGPLPENPMKPIPGPPTFAVEVRNEHEYGDAAEADMAAKRADYFQAGTLVVWDVDPVAEAVACYRAADPTNPTIWHRGDTADAEPAVPGWRIAVDDVFA